MSDHKYSPSLLSISCTIACLVLMSACGNPDANDGTETGNALELNLGKVSYSSEAVLTSGSPATLLFVGRPGALPGDDGDLSMAIGSTTADILVRHPDGAFVAEIEGTVGDNCLMTYVDTAEGEASETYTLYDDLAGLAQPSQTSAPFMLYNSDIVNEITVDTSALSNAQPPLMVVNRTTSVSYFVDVGDDVNVTVAVQPEDTICVFNIGSQAASAMICDSVPNYWP